MIKVLVVDDSAYSRLAITKMLGQHPEIMVIDTAINGEEAIRKIMRSRPDVVTLDLEMSGMDGFSVLRWLGGNMPTPVVVVSAKASDRNVFKALEMGAVDFVAKPTGKASPLLNQMEQDLITKVLFASKARVPAPQTPAPAPAPPPIAAVQAPAGAYEMVVIGASTGGPPALQKIFSSLPMLGVPMIIAQHMPPVFTSLFAERLNKMSPLEVVEAGPDERLEPGKAYITPGGLHATIELRAGRPILHLLPKRESDLYCPSVNMLFHSAAKIMKDKLIAVLLTGMGDDGAEGMLEIKRAGGLCIAESMESAIIFGMPGEAIRLGAADHVLPCWQIPPTLVQLLQKKQ